MSYEPPGWWDLEEEAPPGIHDIWNNSPQNLSDSLQVKKLKDHHTKFENTSIEKSSYLQCDEPISSIQLAFILS
jgi:hypothetical protein